MKEKIKILKVLFERTFQFVGIHVRTVPFDDLAFFIHDKLGKVPLYKRAQRAALLLLQICPERMCTISVYVYFLKQVEFHLREINSSTSVTSF